MSEICSTLATDILRDCTNKPVPGVEQKLVLIPANTRSSYTRSGGLITALTLSAAGFTIDGIKDIMNFQNSFVNPDDGESGFKHGIQGIRIQDPSVEVRNAINAMATGGNKYFAVLERRWQGANQDDAFLFFGTEFGLEVPDGGIIDNSNENDGCMVLTLTTGSIFKEPRVPDVLLLTNYDTTKTAFDAAFAP